MKIKCIKVYIIKAQQTRHRGDDRVFWPTRRHSENKARCRLQTWYVYSRRLHATWHLRPLVSHVGKTTADSVAFHLGEVYFIEKLQPAPTHCVHKGQQSESLLASILFSPLYRLISRLGMCCYTVLLSNSITKPLVSRNMCYRSTMSTSAAEDILFASVLPGTPPQGSLLICLTFGASEWKESEGHVIWPGWQQLQIKTEQMLDSWKIQLEAERSSACHQYQLRSS